MTFIIDQDVTAELEAEFTSAWIKYGAFTSIHQAYGIILEEVDEFWDICKMKRKQRDAAATRTELLQIAAMCIKAVYSMDNFVGPERDNAGKLKD